MRALGGEPRMNQEPYPHERTRPFWRWHVRIFIVSALVCFGLYIRHASDTSGGSDWYWLIPFVTGALLMLHLHYFVRCPRCSRRIRARVVKEREMNSWRYLYDCPACQTTWDSGFVQDAGSGG